MGSTEDLFEGQPTGLPAPMSRGSALYLEGSGPAAKVRHVGGYAPFIGFCAGRGVRAEELASDIERLIRFLHAFETRIGSSKLVACSRAYAVPTTNRSAGLFPGCPSGHGKKWTIPLPSRPCRWPRSQDSPAMSGRPCRRRPTSAEGEPLPYGRRWDADGPPSDSYSVDSHPERFAGLHAVARALIDYVSAVYDVDVHEDPAHAADLLRDARNVAKAVQVTPRRYGAASLTFVLTGYPGVMVHAGVLHDFPFPVCGCDACDETAETAADRMEMLVLTVAAGGYSERYPVGSRRWSEYALTAVDGSGSESGRGEPGPAAAARLQDAEIRLREVAGGWSPRPLRDSPGR